MHFVMVTILLTTLLDMIKLQSEQEHGNVEIEVVNEAKKRFAQAMDSYIEYRTHIYMEDRRKKQSKDRITMADSLNSTMKSTAVSIKSLSALSSAPPPPEVGAPVEEFEKWIEEYRNWYNICREAGLNVF